MSLCEYDTTASKPAIYYLKTVSWRTGFRERRRDHVAVAVGTDVFRERVAHTTVSRWDAMRAPLAGDAKSRSA